MTSSFLLTEVEDAGALWARDAEAVRAALEMHGRIVTASVTRHGGLVFTASDASCAAVFVRAADAAAAAMSAQAALAAAAWPSGVELRVRMGLHTGEAHERAGHFYGPTVVRAVRVKDAANGGQILVSATAREALGNTLGPRARLVELGVHELRDLAEPAGLFRLDDPSFVSDLRPPSSGGVRTGNISPDDSVLLGRGAAVGEIERDLGHARVVTLTGVGGIGKTRLALEVGRRRRYAYRDGVWIARLERLGRGDEVLPTLLALFGIESAGRDGLAVLVELLRRSEVLLVLDNCEHVVDAVAAVVSAVVAVCGGVTVLATSREPLEIDGERVRPVTPLDTADDGPAVDLFVLRATESGAEVDRAGDGAAIARLCRRLDGIPLAIELAAARARSLRPAEIADRLDDMSGLLTAGRRDAPTRHQTLQATLDWSFDLLTGEERRVLCRLGVFAGSFGLDAAVAVGWGRDARERVWSTQWIGSWCDRG